MPSTPLPAPRNAPRRPGLTGGVAGAPMAITEQQILDALRAVRDPDRGADIVTLGMITGVVVRDGNVGFAIEVEPARGAHLEPLRKQAEQIVEALPGVLSVTAVLTAETGAGAGGQQAGARPGSLPGSRQARASQANVAAPAQNAHGRSALAPGVRAIVA